MMILNATLTPGQTEQIKNYKIMSTVKNCITTLILIFFFYPVFPQGWECEDCPKRDIGLFDLDVWVENPLETDSSIFGRKKNQYWVELFMVAGGIHNALFDDDPSKECLNYYDGQLAMLSGYDEQNYQYGNNQASLPPPAGTMDEVDYWITGVIADQESDGLTIIKVYVQASGTGETVVEAVDYFDYSVSGLENGRKVAQQLLPLMGKIRDFEKKKRDEIDIVAIDPDGKGATMELKPEKEKIKPSEMVNVKVKLIDCDGVPLKNMKVRLTSHGGSLKPKEVVTDGTGIAKASFTAGTNPGKFAQPFEFDFNFPYTFEINTSGDEGYITIEPMKYDATITISKKQKRILQTSQEDSKTGEVYKRKINESIEASATIYLTLAETQDMPIFNQTWQYYKPLSVNVSSFNYNSKENQYRSGPKYVTNLDYSRNAKKYEIEEKESVTQVPWILIIDNETEKAVKLIPAGYGITYEINEIEKLNSVVYTDDGPERESKTTTKTRSKSIELGPVGEKVPDQTIKKSDTWMQDYLKRQGVELPAGVPIPKVSNEETVKEIHPDILVKFGDGKTSFGGDGRRTIKKELEHGFDEVNLNYNWQMTVNKKKNKPIP